jgi:hypothetical protein
MSGGHFDYNQHKIRDIADEVENLIEKNGKKISEEQIKEQERWCGQDWFKRYPQDLYHHKYPDEVIEKFKEGLKILRQAEVYAHRIDWLISGDDGEDSFLERLKQDLKKLESNE